MIIDANLIEANSTLKARFCVIGSGMGGAAITQKLAGLGFDVLLVEAGGLATHVESRSTVQAQHAGRPFRRPPTRCIELGGSSNQWHGMCAPLDPIDFEARPWIPHSGWPINRADLDPFYREAAELHGVQDDGQLDRSTANPGFKRQAQAIQLDADVVHGKLLQYRKSPRRWKHPLLDLAKQGKIRCMLHAPALELIADESGSRITDLIVGAGSGTARIQADTFIVCAGALETPRLLLNSRNRHSPGIGNAYDLVGRYLLDHPAGNFTKLKFHRAQRAPLYAGLKQSNDLLVIGGLQLTPEQQRVAQVPNHYLMVRPSLTVDRIPDQLRLSFLAIRNPADLSWKQLKAILFNPDILNRVLVTRLGMPSIYRYGDLFFFTEQLPNPESRVQLSPTAKDRYGYNVARIDWQLGKADIDGFQAYTQLLLGKGLRSQQYSIGRADTIELWDDTVASAAHHVGTARMGSTPDRGVVDSNLKVFDINNLFVADGSVFATAGSTNPSLTITALALRLASHLISIQSKG
jgi:choline dehydrogenase-like flavoprotein